MIGNKILILRKQYNLTQEQLAEKMNVARQTISKWELGETSPDIEQAKKLSQIFNVSLDEMLDNDGGVITTHSTNPVPFIIRDKHVDLKHKGDITQIAPTILRYMDIAIPKEMKETKTLFHEED